jgi:iron complex transport system ATP-binding protein
MVYSVKGLSFSYGSGRVIRDLSLTLEPGIFYGLLGPNGCGKTTLLDLLVRHRKPGSGEIAFKGRPLSSWPGRELAKSVALVAQNPEAHFPYTVKEMVMMGRHPYVGRFSSPGKEDLVSVDEAMDRADVTVFKDAPVTELSGGERQRVFFARALAQDTEVLMLDEATSNLDIRHSLALLRTVRDNVEKKGRTVISVFQDINLAALFCHRIIFMRKGSIHTHGPVHDVLDSGVIRDVYGVESRVVDEPYAGSKQVFFSRNDA